ncbi:MAG: DUF6064 family protein [Stappiaceae bacterium]
MGDWQSYSLSDFLLFSSRTYYRLFELANNAFWPGPLLAYAIGLLLLLVIWRRPPSHERITAVALGLAWICSGWIFVWQHYSVINWTANYIAPLFWLEGSVLLLIAVSKTGVTLPPINTPSTRTLFILLAGILLFYPLGALLFGRSLSSAEIYGIAPDPTALATVIVLLIATGRTRWLLMIIPAIWCLISALTMWAMHAQ